MATLRFVEGAVEFAAENAGRISRVTDEVDATRLVGESLAVRAQPTGTGSVEVLMGEVDTERNPFSGEPMLLRRDVRIPEIMEDYGTFAPSETERVPDTYVIPDDLTPVLDKLRDHGVLVTQVDREMTWEVEEFHIAASSVAEREFQQHRERTLVGEYRVVDMVIPRGWYLVSTTQPLGRLVFSLLEPRSGDGLTTWNVLDRALEGEDVYPIRRR